MESGRLSRTFCPGRAEIIPITTENPTALVSKLNKYFTSMGSLTTQKAPELATERNVDIYPAILTAEPTADQCPEAFQFHTFNGNTYIQ